MSACGVPDGARVVRGVSGSVAARVRSLMFTLVQGFVNSRYDVGSDVTLISQGGSSVPDSA